jgi:hypothetical protein
MEIISHRGDWKNAAEKNQQIAFGQSFALGLGTETDFRDYCGELVISHDVASPVCITAEDFFKLYNQYRCGATLALNIKADGLQSGMKQLIEEHQIDNYFVFDMSVPDTIGYLKLNMNVYSRQSEYELQPAFYAECKGIWLDAFHSIWYNNDLIAEHLNNNKKVAIVSPELHGREHLPLWELLKTGNMHRQNEVILCTDLPEQAIAFFKN